MCRLEHVSSISLASEFKARLEALIDEPTFAAAEAEDQQGRTLLAIAEGVNKKSELSAFVRSKTLFLGIYKIMHGDPAHKSATCIVSLAHDFSGDAPVPVALKFMRNLDQFARELKVRKERDLSSEFVVRVLRGYSTTEAPKLTKRNQQNASATFLAYW